jgi:hypothetical protein
MTNQIESMDQMERKTTRPKRFTSIQDNKGLKYKFAREKRDKDIRQARWSKLNREDVVKEKFTRVEMWDNYITELSWR